MEKMPFMMRRFEYREPALKWIYYDTDGAPPEVRNALHNLGLLENCKAPVLRPQTLLLDKLINSWNGTCFDTLHSKFTISAEAIHSITGLPMDGRLVSSHELGETRVQQSVIHELSGPGLKLVKGKIPLDKIRKPLNYWVCGLLYSRCVSACRNNNLLEFGLGKVGVEIAKGGRVNWCQLVADQLTLNLEACRQGTSDTFSFVTILQCWVYDHFPLVQPRWGALPTTNNSPTLFKWRAIDKLDNIRNDNGKKGGRRTSNRSCIDFFECSDPLAILEPYGFAENFEMKEVHCKSENHYPVELVGKPMGDIGQDCERSSASSTREGIPLASSPSLESIASFETEKKGPRQPNYRFEQGLTYTYCRSKWKTSESLDENNVETLVSKRSSFCNALGKREFTSCTREGAFSGSSSSLERLALCETGTLKCRQPEYRFEKGFTNTYSKSKRKTSESPDESNIEKVASKRSSLCNALGKREFAKQLDKICTFAGSKRIQEMHTEIQNGGHVLPDSKYENGGVRGKGEPGDFVDSVVIFCDLVILNDFLTGCNYVGYGLSFLGDRETSKITTFEPERRNVFNPTENEVPEVFHTLQKRVFTQKVAEERRNFQSSTSDKDYCSEDQKLGEDGILTQEIMHPESHRQSNLITPQQLEELREKIEAEEKEIWEAWKDKKLMGVEDMCEVVDRIMNKLKETVPSRLC